MDNQPHGLQTGQSVVFKEVNGMVELNGTVQQVSGIIFQVSLNVHVFMKCSMLMCHVSDQKGTTAGFIALLLQTDILTLLCLALIQSYEESDLCVHSGPPRLCFGLFSFFKFSCPKL